MGEGRAPVFKDWVESGRGEWGSPLHSQTPSFVPMPWAYLGVPVHSPLSLSLSLPPPWRARTKEAGLWQPYPALLRSGDASSAAHCCLAVPPGLASVNPTLPGLPSALTQTPTVTSFLTPQPTQLQSNKPSAPAPQMHHHSLPATPKLPCPGGDDGKCVLREPLGSNASHVC